VVTYEEQIMTDALPGSIIIAGAGAIGVEFAYVMANYGVDVTIVEYLDRLVPLEDEEVSAELARRYKKLGIKALTSTRVDAIDDSGGSVKVTVTRGDKQETLEADKVLQAIGFSPRVDGYGLDAAGVELTERGAVAIDGLMRTNVDSIYAIGDVTAKLMLAHNAEAMGIVAAEAIAGVETMEIDYVMVPRATYCQPQIASFGYTEAQARELGREIKVAKFPFAANGKAHGLGESGGFVKIVADAEYGEFLGAHLVGPDVVELLPELTLAQKWDLTAAEVARNIHAHPTLSEAVKEAVHGIAGHMINF
jgi:dihydrolipoamide dehydrogenase